MKLNQLETYILDNEQPATCPKCGARTDFIEWRYKGDIIQKHFCLWQYCKYVFIGEFEDEKLRYEAFV